MDKLNNIYIGRQPIFDANMRVYAYELLFRACAEENRAKVIGGDSATAQVIMNLFGDMGLSNVVGERKAFINFTEGLLLRENRPFFPRKQVVIEVLENIEPTPEVLAAIKKLREEGFTIALDDYIFQPSAEAFEDYADIVKVDILEAGPKKLVENLPKMKEKGVKLLAEKVETREQFDFCKKLGFDYFQGYFFSRPKIIEGKSLPANKVPVLRLLSSVYDPDIDMSKLSEIISQDLSMSQKLLKMASMSGGNHQISSIHDAVLRFGLKRLQSWASVLVLSNIDDKPSELFVMSLIRAKFCELVGDKVGDFNKDSYFTVGLFSTLDALMDQPLAELLSELNFDAKIKEALIKGTGSLGRALKAVKAMEASKMDFELPDGLTPSEISQMYLEAMQFTESLKLVE
ncbi:EAL and HDOD domain-containing protein [Hydrogenovibrio sp. JE_KL2]|uniref:EAL and HDOD domain-containing protein n=1 Tax=Hydrogenovibrio sp. JE_KL2 TaxID=2651188 RepID=UPI00128E0582|nr:EAL domain-containing protein [Hydrogenovibrio sp. JE_KL2]MPQ77197.1 EAL domain-containing protein [Hydrogenovibrio sp. JE_KL2]